MEAFMAQSLVDFSAAQAATAKHRKTTENIFFILYFLSKSSLSPERGGVNGAVIVIFHLFAREIFFATRDYGDERDQMCALERNFRHRQQFKTSFRTRSFSPRSI
jgi:hypothetical protein